MIILSKCLKLMMCVSYFVFDLCFVIYFCIKYEKEININFDFYYLICNCD